MYLLKTDKQRATGVTYRYRAFCYKLRMVLSPLLPVAVVYHILESHATTAALLRDVDEWSFLVRNAWSDHGMNSMPNTTYAEYHASWGDQANPLDVDWESVDMTELDAVAYVAAVLNSLTVDVANWSQDSGIATRGEVFSFFLQFIESLEELFRHCTSVSTLRANILSQTTVAAAA